MRSPLRLGLIGTGFHLYNIGKRTGGFSWQNLFYAAPAGSAGRVESVGTPRRRGRARAGHPHSAADRRLLGAAGRPRIARGSTSLGLLGTVGEAGLLHLRGAYHNPAMWLPVSLPPVAAGLLAASAAAPAPRRRRIAKTWLRLTALLGFVGAGFHAYGVSRGMGGWRNWTQNLLNGPPIPAPPSFTGLALAGLAALELQEEDRHER